MNKITYEQLKVRQGMPLNCKINMSLQRIKTWYDHFHGNVYVGFSGGKDSTVLLHLVRKFYPHVPAVFCNTGLEYPEILKFVKTVDNVTWLRPEMTFKEVIEKYGFPVVSKMQAQYIEQYRNTKSKKLRDLRWRGKDYGHGPKYKISEKWKFLIHAPFKISDKCCNIMKKKPFILYEKETSRKGIIGIMATDSDQRQKQYLQQGCNVFNAKISISRPLMFWAESDIWEYIKKNNVPYSDIYKGENAQNRTGCIFCGFGAHLNNPNRFQKMRITHPKLWEYCMGGLGLRAVLDYCKIPSL